MSSDADRVDVRRSRRFLHPARLMLAMVLLIAVSTGCSTLGRPSPVSAPRSAAPAVTVVREPAGPPAPPPPRTPPARPARPAVTPAANTLTVVGRQLVDGGQAVTLTGVSRSGTEYACVQGWGIFDGPTGIASIAAIRAWGVNTVRVPLNEDCWLGINGVSPAYSGARYRGAVTAWVDRLRKQHLWVILDLHLTAPGPTLAVRQAPMPDAAHSPAFWASVGATFRNTPGVLYELYNEPRAVSWSCWRNGCRVDGYPAVGMQRLIDAVRGSGARQPIIVEGLGWGNDLSRWARSGLVDPLGQLVAGWHAYRDSPCADRRCWDATVAPVAARVPVVATEFGETDCDTAFTAGLLAWSGARGVSSIAWAWDTWKGCGGPSLIRSWAGAPTAAGRVYREYLRSRRDPAP